MRKISPEALEKDFRSARGVAVVEGGGGGGGGGWVGRGGASRGELAGRDWGEIALSDVEEECFECGDGAREPLTVVEAVGLMS